MAASAAAAIGGVGIGFSGAGADVKNVILTDTSAHINNSTIHQSGSLNIHANNDAVIHAEVLSASAALGGGVLSGAVSIGSSTAKNYVGYKLDDTSNPLIVKAYITNSNLCIGGNVDITAEMGSLHNRNGWRSIRISRSRVDRRSDQRSRSRCTE